MSCNFCTTKFNFFHKELGCAHCGLSFCSKCLKQKCKIPNKGNAEQNVCRICYTKLAAGTSSNDVNIPPPDSFIRRLENLENPVAPPITLYQNDTKIQKLRTGLSVDDQKILDRLEKLREDRKRVIPPTESELRKRLANLKGENPYVENTHKQIFLPDTRSEDQKVDSLLEQFINERDIQLAHNPEEEIQARLLRLREQGVRPNESPYLDSLHDSSGSEEEEVEKISKKIMDEVSLDEKCSISNVPLPKMEDTAISQSPELPWCVLCNKDASFRCIDCSNDLYCVECNKEIHKNWGYNDHNIVEFRNT